MNPPADPAQPKSLGGWRKAKSVAADEAVIAFADTLGLVEVVLSKFLELHGSVQPIDQDEKRLLLDIMLLGTHRLLFNVFDLLVERQNVEALAVLRSAIEMAAAAAKIGRNPELALVWLQREKAEAAFNATFKPQFPQGDLLTGPLKTPYDLTCNFGSHGNAHLFALTLEIKDGRAVNAFYFVQDDAAVRRLLIYCLEVATRILNVYADGLKVLAKAEITLPSGVLESAIYVHKEKYRTLFSSVTT